ncbi:hypothetical protein Moror_3873 [Moniliophthora roreri MCA 2997]|uniref:G domain-containing protein n=1 Tax=Moniliophthora roreri (strain MCA 2997) TaxID=1381753 RepID=V2X835_MONRO|nr:hypothetical protein Moror_3873 [Moniliophthora roreri MCA 2997]
MASDQFVNIEEATVSTKEAVIAIMGATGSGKTTFINAVSGGNLRVGGDLESCTSTIELSPTFDLRGRQVTLIDTPGFDDTNRSDADILNMIAVGLASMYENNQMLAGVIYLHRISDIRMGGISRRNFKMFRKLCGDNTLKNVVIVTNMWGLVDKDVGVAREAQLKQEDKFFKPALEKGAQIVRHDNTPENARAILCYLIERKPLPLQIQIELVDEQKTMPQTAAGAELNRELLEQSRKHEKEMRELREEMQDALRQRDEEHRKELEAERQALQAEIDRVEGEHKKLASDYAKQKAELEEQRREASEKAAELRQQIQALQNDVTAGQERERLERELREVQQQLRGLQAQGPRTRWCSIM